MPHTESKERLAVFHVSEDGGQGARCNVGGGSCKKGAHH